MEVLQPSVLCSTDIDGSALPDASLKQADWDTSKIREKLHRDIEAHASSVCSAKLSEMTAKYEVTTVLIPLYVKSRSYITFAVFCLVNYVLHSSLNKLSMDLLLICRINSPKH